LIKKKRKEKNSKKFAGDCCLNGLHQCGAMLNYVDDSAFFLLDAQIGRVLEHYGATEMGMLRFTSHIGPLMIGIEDMKIIHLNPKYLSKQAPSTVYKRGKESVPYHFIVERQSNQFNRSIFRPFPRSSLPTSAIRASLGKVFFFPNTVPSASRARSRSASSPSSFV